MAGPGIEPGTSGSRVRCTTTALHIQAEVYLQDYLLYIVKPVISFILCWHQAAPCKMGFSNNYEIFCIKTHGGLLEFSWGSWLKLAILGYVFVGNEQKLSQKCL